MNKQSAASFERLGGTYLKGDDWTDRFNGMSVVEVMKANPKLSYQDLVSVINNEGGIFMDVNGELTIARKQ